MSGKRPALCPIDLAHGFRAWDAFPAAINHLGRIEILAAIDAELSRS
jgi:hypothetical protein